jgi:large repetitive protein
MNSPQIAKAVIAVLAWQMVGVGNVQAQSGVFSVTPSTNATTLAQSIVGTGVTLVGTPTLTGMTGQAGLFDAFTTGPFQNPVTNATGNVSIPRGVILSSGLVQNATGSYLGGADADLGGAGDTALSGIAGFATQDAVSLEFSFIPDSNEIFIEYLFASTEYPGFVNSSFNDVFAFFVNGVNVALVAGTNDPVTINKINAGNPVGTGVTNPQFFTQYSTSNTPFNYGGATVLLTARATVTKGVVNTFRFAIADASDGSLDSAVMIGAGKFTTINPTSLAVATPTLPNAQIQVPYSQQLSASGGTPGYSWAATSGTLPPGLVLTPAGVIQGTPSQQGTFNFGVTVTDSTGATATKSLSITVLGPGPIITTPSLPAGQALISYATQLQASGGSPPFKWTMAGGSLPSGFALTESGAIIGNSAEPLSTTFDVRVTDSLGRASTKSFTLVIAVRTVDTRVPEVATAALPEATVGKIYGMTLAGRNGIEPYSWAFSGLPEGLQGNTSGEILGTPTRTGTFAVQVALTDGAGTRINAAFSLIVRPPQITITTQAASDGRIGEPYSLNFAATGGIPPYTFTLLSGALPAGLTLASNGLLSGTPTQLGAAEFSIQATDSTGGSGSRSFGMRVRPPALIITTPSLGTGVLNTAFSLRLSAAGGSPEYKWSATGLPDGLSLNTDTGLITGTPTRNGRYEVAVRVTDQAEEFTVRNYSMDVITQVTITSTIGSMIVGVPVSTALSATGGRNPLTWTVLSGALPAGISLSSEGLLSGTPTTTGETNFTIQARDADGITGTRSFAVRVVEQLVITSQTAPPAPFGAAYTFGLTATGGTPPYSWSVASGNLPPGLSLDAATGTISGSATTPGTFNLTAQSVDGANPPQTAQRALTIQVVLPDVSGLNFNLPANPQAAQQLPVTVGIPSPYPVEITGNLNLTFAPNAANNADDPAIQFSTGGRTVPFTIPAGQTQAVFRVTDLGVQTGTTAGTITLAATLQAAGGPIGCNCPLNQTIVIPRTAPVITAVRASRTATGFSVVITGFSTSRDGTQGVFRFAGTNTLDTTELTVQLATTFNTFFQSAASAQTGGQFTLTVPFTIQGDTSAVNSVTVTLTNAAGTSQPVTATF